MSNNNIIELCREAVEEAVELNAAFTITHDTADIIALAVLTTLAANIDESALIAAEDEYYKTHRLYNSALEECLKKGIQAYLNSIKESKCLKDLK